MLPSTVFRVQATGSIGRGWFWSMVIALTAFATPLAAQHLPPGFASNPVQQGYTVPVGAIFSVDGRQLFVWEKAGRVWVSTWNGTTYVRQDTPVIDISEEVGNWRDFGLLSTCLDPNFSSNGLIYLYYVVDRHHLLHYGTDRYNRNADEYYDASISRVTRYRTATSSGNLTADSDSRRVLLGETKTTGIPLTYESHAGGTLLFGRDGTLLVSTGDAASYDGADMGSDGRTYFRKALDEGIMRPAENVGAFRSQLVGSLCGKVLRIDPRSGDGLPGNPFFDGGNARSPRSRMWAMGLRNPYRVTLQPNTGSTNPNEGNPGTLLIGDVGWATAEDVNVFDRPGLNGGWPLYEGLDVNYQYYGVYLRNEDEPGQPTFESLCLPPTSPAPHADPARRRFTHARPVLDWLHNQVVARIPAFEGSTPINRTIGKPGAPAGVPFRGNASMGGAYYTGTQFPAEYRNTYFFTDFGQNWIRSLTLHHDGDHAVHEVREFARAGFVPGIVDLELNPLNGSLFCVSIDGQITRISYGGNQPPTARPTADRTSGPSPLRVQFAGDASSDPEGGLLTYRWDFGDGTTSNQANPEHVFTQADERRYTVTLTVTDEGQFTNTSQVSIALNGTAPTARITSPADGSLYPLDRPSVYNPTAEVTGSNLTYEWQVTLLHNTHGHPEAVVNGTSPSLRLSPVGCSGNEPYSYRISLKVTSPGGLTATSSVQLFPDCQSGSVAVRQLTATPLPNAMRVDWQQPAVAYDEVLVAARPGTAISDHPSGTNYAADARFGGNGTPFGGGRVVYRGRGQTVRVSELSASSPYYFRVYTRIGETWNEGVETSATPTGEPTATGGFGITGVNLMRCESVSNSQRRISFAPQYSGLNSQPVSFSIVGEMLPTANPGPYTLNVYTDNPTITLSAVQPGTDGEVRFAYNWLAVCTSGSTTPPVTTPPPPVSPPVLITSTPSTPGTTPPVTTGGFGITDVNLVRCESVSNSQRRISFAPQYSGLNSQPVSFSIVGEMLPTANPGPYTLNVYTDNPTITLSAVQPGTDGEVRFAYNWLAVCASGSTTPPVVAPSTVANPPVSVAPPATSPVTTGFGITGVNLVRCETVSNSQRLLTFTPQYSGLNGQPVSFRVANEMAATTNAGPYALNLYADNPTITLNATQPGTADEVSFSYDWLAACGRSGARLGAESADSLTVRILGNPVRTETVEVEIRGGAGQWLRLQTLNLQGLSLFEMTIAQPALIERRTIRLPGSVGLYLLRVRTSTQYQTVKILKQ